ncbi:DNA fragmentation factor subunit beta-like isoform X2 [Dermacentor silvarum]|uniref:DNA fragmentation factor subunit beta-like isoform X2 n=1 Tax=Dermacentor silvarum TaxID=543639 RepID=UPI0018997591|nr:DNA fragmentation factor subunit beta-like isoform X2 [Dermacentor silvarum]
MTGGVVHQTRKVNGAQHVECKHGHVKAEPRPYIVSNFKGQRKLVTGSTCEDLLSTGCKIFDVRKTDCRLVLEDGTEIDDEYLATCDTQVKAQQMIANIGKLLASDPQQLNKIFNPVKDELVSKMLGHIQSLEAPQVLLLADSREEDPKWFEGEKRAVSKRSVLRERAKTRIKGYYYKSKDEMQKRLGENDRGCVRHLFEEFLRLLKQHDHNGHYFVRGDTGALCLSDGQFNCQGTFSKDLCSGRLHMINPYASREQLVIFSTWNLDHRIERSRSILPTMSKAIQLADGRAINVEYFYRLLFTTENLKLVHPVCHIKAEHNGYCCDPRSWYAGNVTQNDGRGDESIKRMQESGQSVE